MRSASLATAAGALLVALVWLPVGTARAQDAAELGAKLSNPVSDVWALFTELDLDFSDGDLNRGDSLVGSRMIFQPVLPFPCTAPRRSAGT